jgi:hypothetical protein
MGAVLTRRHVVIRNVHILRRYNDENRKSGDYYVVGFYNIQPLYNRVVLH